MDDIFSDIDLESDLIDDEDLVAIDEFDVREFAMERDDADVLGEDEDDVVEEITDDKKRDLDKAKELLDFGERMGGYIDKLDLGNTSINAIRRMKTLAALKQFRYGSQQIPKELRIRIDLVLRNVSRKLLKSDAAQLSILLRKRTVTVHDHKWNLEIFDNSENYMRDPLSADIKQIAKDQVKRNIPALPYNERQSAAYTAFRLPGVFGCNARVFNELKSFYPDFEPKSMLDFGSGPGTSIWSAKSVFPTLDFFHTVEPSEDMHNVAKILLKGFSFTRSLYLSPTVNRKYDIVHASYAMTEFDDEIYRYDVVSMMWEYVRDGGYMVIIEPGTSMAFNILKKLRQKLIDTHKDLKIVAPCTHAFECPITNKQWCSFSQRVERIPVSRSIKEHMGRVSQSWEDETYSYLILQKGEATTKYNPEYISQYADEGKNFARIILPPKKKSGHVVLHACTDTGVLRDFVISKSLGKVLYTSARKVRWGDGFEYHGYVEAHAIRKRYKKVDWSEVSQFRKSRKRELSKIPKSDDDFDFESHGKKIQQLLQEVKLA